MVITQDHLLSIIKHLIVYYFILDVVFPGNLDNGETLACIESGILFPTHILWPRRNDLVNSSQKATYT